MSGCSHAQHLSSLRLAGAWITYTLEDWSRGDTPAVTYDMLQPGSWERLLRHYANNVGELALNRIFEIARGHGVVTVLVETRYIDADWRSQLSRFYNGSFRRYPSVCHRLHFFTQSLPEDLENLTSLQDHYCGYTILRPFLIAPVGRTMIAPPAELANAVRCEDTETVEVFGWALRITAMPFISQDTQFLRCAHAAVWMVLRHAHLSQGLARLMPHDIHDAALGGVMVGRQLPSDGLSGYQLFAAMERLGLSPTRKELPADKLAEETAGPLRLYAMVCRYVNSSLPPIVISNEHAWVIVAYKRARSPGNSQIELWRHDDARGPYIRVPDPWEEPEQAHNPWVAIYLPLLPKVFLDAERAEVVGRTWLEGFRTSALYSGTTVEEADRRIEPLEQTTLRTFLMRSSDFKEGLVKRAVPDELARAYRRAPMSRYVWVIEIVDRKRRAAGEQDVLGEILLDSTLTQFEPLYDPASVLALHVDSMAFIPGVDNSQSFQPQVTAGAVYESACEALRTLTPTADLTAL